MKSGLIPGVSEELSFIVTEDMCPSFDGHVVHRVCATWTLVHYMEVAGRMILMKYLEEGEEGVGHHVSCDHLGPAGVGATVRVVATVVGVSAGELTCDTFAYRGEHLIAKGRTGQRVFPRKMLERILNRAT
jgi:fluoroacetyl-CoA thioesterase